MSSPRKITKREELNTHVGWHLQCLRLSTKCHNITSWIVLLWLKQTLRESTCTGQALNYFCVNKNKRHLPLSTLILLTESWTRFAKFSFPYILVLIIWECKDDILYPSLSCDSRNGCFSMNSQWLHIIIVN